MSNVKVKSSLHSSVFSLSNKSIRVLWAIVYNLFFRLSPVPFFAYRRCVLRVFGTSIGSGVKVYPSVKIWLPSNLTLRADSSVGPNVNIYNQGVISIDQNVIVSQGAYLCASTHDYNDPKHSLILAPITIGKNSWVCAEAFVGPGVTVSEGTVVGARAVISKDTECWGIYAGNPARLLKKRVPFSDE